MTRLALCLVAALGCGGRLAANRSTPPAVEPPSVTSFARYGDAAAVSAVDRPPITYEFLREPTPVDVDLHGLVITTRADSPAVYAVGDDGVILVRTLSTPWQRDPSGTRARLDAVAAIEDEQVLAVGEHGTALVRGRDGRWRPEATGVEVELTALAGAVAVGRGGVLIERGRDGRWSSIATRTRADLRAVWRYEGVYYDGGGLIQSLYLAGDGGVIVHCAMRHQPPVCIPRPSPTTADLIGFGQFDSRERFILFGADGRIFRPTGLDPFSWTVSTEDGAIFLRSVVNRSQWVVGRDSVRAEPLAVGRAGRVAFLTAQGPVGVTLAGGADLTDVATAGIDFFAVGQRGTVVHGVARDVSIAPPVQLY